jgi:hypothetical protein
VVDVPAHIVALVTVVPTLGNAFTVMSRVAVAVHPLAPVPVTVYVVVLAGDTLMVVPVNDPGCQLYVDAPVPVILVLPPAHMVALVTVVPTLGNAFTVMSRVAVALHPLAPVPVTV